MSYPPPPPPPDASGGYGYGGYAAPRTNQKAIWSLVTGILSLVCCGLLAGVPALILGNLAKKEIDGSGGAQTGRGMAQAGFVLGVISTVLSVLYIIGVTTGAISIPVPSTSP
jgi:hypothetical protein